MKTIIKRLSVIIVVVLFFSCSSDSESDAPVVKTRVKITRIDVASTPNSNGAFYWDSSTDNPDLYIKCYDEIGTLVVSSTTLWNYVPTSSNPFSVTFTTPISTTDLINTILKVQVWDDDSDNNLTGLNPNDKMGEVPFYISDYTTGTNKYPDYAVKSDGNGTIVTLYFTWE